MRCRLIDRVDDALWLPNPMGASTSKRGQRNDWHWTCHDQAIGRPLTEYLNHIKSEMNTHTHTQNSSDNLLRCFRAGGADDTGVGDSVACWSMPCGRWTASPLPRFPASPFPRLTAGRLGPVTPRFRPSSKRVPTGLRRGFRRGSGGGSDGGSDGGCDPVIRGYRRVQAGSGGGWNWQWPPRVTPMQ